LTSVFALPVAGDSFGTDASWGSDGEGGVLIVLGSNPTITGIGDYVFPNHSAGSPSGLLFRADAPTDSVTSSTGVLAASSTVDIFEEVLTPGPQMTLAVVDGLQEFLTITFDQDVSYDPSSPLNDTFFLPVIGDTFGDISGSLPRLVTPLATNQVRIELGPNLSMNTSGFYVDGVHGTGSPSGISSIAGGPMSYIFGAVSNVPMQATTIDIEGLAPPVGEINLSLVSTGVTQVPLGFDTHAMMGVQVSNSTAFPAVLDRIAFDVVTTLPFDMWELATRWRLFEDADASGDFNSADTMVAIGQHVGSFVEFFPSINSVSSGNTITLWLVMDASPNSDLAGTDFTLRAIQADGVDVGTPTSVPVNGLPFLNPVQTYTLNSALPSTNEVLGHAYTVAPAISGGQGRFGVAGISTDMGLDRFPYTSTLTPDQIQFSTITDIANAQIDFRLEVSQPAPFISILPASPALTDSNAKTHALMVAIRTQIDAMGLEEDFECFIDRRGNLVLRGYSFDTGLAFDPLGGFGETLVGGRTVRRTSGWEDEEYAIFFGGSDGSTVYSTLSVYRQENDSLVPADVTIIPDPIEGTPSARFDAAMTIDENGWIYMNGGRDNSNVFADTWALIPVFGPLEEGLNVNGLAHQELRALRWRQLSSGAGTQHYAHQLVYVAGSSVFPNAGLVAIGGVDGALNASSTIEYYNLRTESWSTISPVSGSIPTLVSFVAGYDPHHEALVLVGGGTNPGGTAQSTAAFVVNFTSPTTYALSAINPDGALPQAHFRAAGFYDYEDREIVFAGGSRLDGSVSSGAAVLRFDPNFVSARWLHVSASLDESIVTRSHATLVGLDGFAAYAFGVGASQQPLDSIAMVEIGGFSPNNDEDSGMILALIRP
ncbi:MAG: hypothetical protein KDB07_13470, partial [Planctomycetes bacterium]|nr:hypothetical protein [Planctomycetota bacterium]